LSFTRNLLKNVTAVRVWSGYYDANVPKTQNTTYKAQRLPTRPAPRVTSANQFAFPHDPCGEVLKIHHANVHKLVYSDANGFGRRAFHKDKHIEMARFYNWVFAIVG